MNWTERATRLAAWLGKGLRRLADRLLALLDAARRCVTRHAAPPIWRWLKEVAWPALRGTYLRLPHRRAVIVSSIAVVAVATLMLAAVGEQEAERPARTPASVSEASSCRGLLTHTTWTGTVSYSHARDVRDPQGNYHVTYRFDVRLDGELRERTRRGRHGVDELVQYYSPLPRGTARVQYRRDDYDGGGALLRRHAFVGSSGMQRQEQDMVEDGSSLSLTLDARRCTYQFYLQGQVLGSGEIWEASRGARPYQGHMPISSVRGEGALTPGTAISGSGPIPLMSSDRIHDNSIEKTNWASEQDSVVRALGEDGLGVLTVHWHFAPKN